jgi:hypothetical protein
MIIRINSLRFIKHILRITPKINSLSIILIESLNFQLILAKGRRRSFGDGSTWSNGDDLGFWSNVEKAADLVHHGMSLFLN